ncbi:MAG TPA: YciI family protein [Candidatus Limnocylindrales bacterium]|nr:YciI family protein [Candidatus Limnocylindrales bacterium]
MQYAILIYDTGTADPTTVNDDPEEWQRTMGAYNAYTAMLREQGAYKAGEALEPVSTATTIRLRDGETVMTDGPFAETKEALGGFYLIEAADLDAALELAAKCPGVRYGSIEVRPVVDFSAAGG